MTLCIAVHTCLLTIISIIQETECSTRDPETRRTSTKQIVKSEQQLDKLVTDGTTLVTNVKVAGESKEVSRRQEEDEAKKSR